jgi:hypothetical protein
MSRRPLPESIKLFAHYSLPRPETYAKVGGFVCGTPLHVTFASIITRRPESVMETLHETLREPLELPHMRRDGMTVAHSYYRLKPIILLHDTAKRLEELQRHTLDAVAPLKDTTIASRTCFTDGRTPHVTIDRLTPHSHVPEEFDIDHIMVTSGTKIEPGHWHNFVWDIINLTDSDTTD